MRSIRRLAPAGLFAFAACLLVATSGCSSTQLDTAAADLHATAATATPLSADLRQIGATLPTTQAAAGINKTAASIDQLGAASAKLGDAAQVLANSARPSGSVDLTDPAVQKALAGVIITAVQTAAPSQAPQVVAYSTTGLAIAGLIGTIFKAHGTANAAIAALAPSPPVAGLSPAKT